MHNLSPKAMLLGGSTVADFWDVMTLKGHRGRRIRGWGTRILATVDTTCLVSPACPRLSGLWSCERARLSAN